MGPDEAQHERGQLLLVAGVPVAGIGEDAQLVVRDVRREPPGVLGRDDLVSGAVDREHPARRSRFLLHQGMEKGANYLLKRWLEVCVCVSPAVFADGAAGKKGVGAQPILETRF